MKDIIIYTDGSVYPNPGGMGGWAFVAPNYHGEGEHYEYRGNNHSTTNNRMELTAALNAVSIVERGRFATIITDSQYVQRCFARRQWPDSKPNADLGRMLISNKEGRFIEVKLIPGHSGDKWNDRAHELANKARLEGLEYQKQRAAERKMFETMEFRTAEQPSTPTTVTPDRIETSNWYVSETLPSRTLRWAVPSFGRMSRSSTQTAF
jgi:ribonuclease HI